MVSNGRQSTLADWNLNDWKQRSKSITLPTFSQVICCQFLLPRLKNYSTFFTAISLLQLTFCELLGLSTACASEKKLTLEMKSYKKNLFQARLAPRRLGRLNTWLCRCNFLVTEAFCMGSLSGKC